MKRSQTKISSTPLTADHSWSGLRVWAVVFRYRRARSSQAISDIIVGKANVDRVSPATQGPDDWRCQETLSLIQALDMQIAGFTWARGWQSKDQRDGGTARDHDTRRGWSKGLHPAFYLHAGARDEVRQACADRSIDIVVIDGSLSPIQQRNLEKYWSVKVIDRTGIILAIFAARARTREGQLQVQLATLIYQKSRLVRFWTHLERQRGGRGFLAGPGERQIESDRRQLTQSMIRIKGQIASVVRRRDIQRARRRRQRWPVVALVGYTNAGKSTLFNLLTKASVPVKDQVFATLDPTMRVLRLDEVHKVFLVDTVGFIVDLPPGLVAAFAATLEEVVAADAIIHLHDISSPDYRNQAEQVIKILGQIGCDIQLMRKKDHFFDVFNKIDCLTEDKRQSVIMRDDFFKGVMISGRTGRGIGALLAKLVGMCGQDYSLYRLDIQAVSAPALTWLYRHGAQPCDQDPNTALQVSLSARDFADFSKIFSKRLLQPVKPLATNILE